MATSNDLVKAVAGFMRRKPEDFTKNNFDCLLQACNNARLFAERQIDFEMSRVSVDIPSVSLINGGSLNGAVLHSDGTTPISVKKIKRPFLMFANQTNTVPISFYSRDAWLRRLQRNWDRVRPVDYTVFNNPQWWTSEFYGFAQQFAVVQQGRNVVIVPGDERALGSPTITLYADVLQWLPAYGSTLLESTTTGTETQQLVDTAATFVTDGVAIGTVVRNTTDGTSALVTAVVSETTLLLNADIFVAAEEYSINVLDETDFLLDYCFDWLMYRAIWELNFFLKEDERVELSERLIGSAWEAVKSWNENLISQSVDDSDLS